MVLINFLFQSVIEPNGNNSFEFTFLRLCPARKYTAHIASYDASMENITSNGNITFDVKPILGNAINYVSGRFPYCQPLC